MLPDFIENEESAFLKSHLSDEDLIKLKTNQFLMR